MSGGTRRTSARRAAALIEIERLAPELGGVTAAIEHLAQRPGLSCRTLWRWWRQRRERPSRALPLRQTPTPPWASALLRLWRTPSKRSLRDVVEQLAAELPEGAPSYDQAKRYVRGMSAVERARGRLGPTAIRAVKAFRRRDVSNLLPTDVYISDGHTFDAEIEHPTGGQPCRPELTCVLDVRTRLWVGWSAALAESTWAVADALRDAVTRHGVPAIYYADRGPGQRNDVLEAMLDRLGVTVARSIARNSQARGVIEAFNRRLISASKRLPTYMGADMDRDARQRVHQLTRRDLRRIGRSRLLLPWDQFRGYVDRERERYNASPHSSLPRADGRHMSPIEAWQAAIDGTSFAPVMLPPEIAEDLFRPYELRICRRGEIALHGKRYFARCLEHYDGAEVVVGYDIHDPSRVWVRDRDDRLLAIAGLDANATPYFPAARVDQAREQRARRRLERLDAKREGVIAELHRPRLVEPVEDEPEWAPETVARHERLVEQLTAPEPAPEPTEYSVVAYTGTEDDQWFARARWLQRRLQAGEEIAPEEASWLEVAETEPWYRALLRAEERSARFWADAPRAEAS